MILRYLMRLDNFLILTSILFIFVVACTSVDNFDTADSCILFKEKKNWYKSTKKTYDKWGVPNISTISYYQSRVLI